MKHLLNLMVILITAILTAACSPTEKQTPESRLTLAQNFADNLTIKYQVKTNRTNADCDPQQTDGLCFQAQLTLHSAIDVNTADWAIYFSNMAPIQMDTSELFDIVHVNGDLHRIEPTEQLQKLASGETYTIDFTAGFWHLSQTDMMPNYYLVMADAPAITIASTVPEIDPETGLELLPHSVPLSLADKHFKRTESDLTEPATAAWLYQENQAFYQDVDVTNRILPTPKSVIEVAETGQLDLTAGINLTYQGIEAASVLAALQRLDTFGVKQDSKGVEVVLKLNQELAQESYTLAISSTDIKIEAGSDTGAFYALQSIASLLMPNSLELPLLRIEDEPRFGFRGMHFDVSRNFKSKQFVLQLLEQMAAYKLNKFHFHLADDEGWRVQISDLPELTEVGAFRCHDLTEQSCLLPQLGVGPHRDSPANGYYNIADYKEIVAYANARHIQVIPSMDMPGHSRAAIKSMAVRFNNLMAKGQTKQAKQYLLHDIEDSTEYSSIQFYNDNTINACLDSSYDFIGKVIDELAIMHQQAGQPLRKYHIGADETAGAWIDSPACKDLLAENVMGIEKAEDIAAHFIEKVAAMLEQRGIQAAGWSDGMGHTATERMPKNVQTNAWTPLMWDGHKSAHEQANRGWQVVLSSPDALYFDFPYEADANERGYYWAARRLNSRKVFEFMPENLPAHAEVWRDRQETSYQAVNDVPLKQGIEFHGIQGQFWSETVRTDEQASYMIFPRLYALAERAWHKASWEMDYDYGVKTYSSQSNYFTASAQEDRSKDWQGFANLLGKKILPKAELEQVFYRLPTPGAQIQQGKLVMNSIYPGLPMLYRVNRGPWQSYQSPVAVTGEVEVRTGSAMELRKGRILVVTP